jgi:pimeloyl-ACP methyl ester carboxylesterase
MKSKSVLTQISLLVIASFSAISIYSQTDKSQPYEEKFVQANKISLHYLDFGGRGLPIIFLQSFHDDAKEWVDFSRKGFAPRFTKTNRVFAITRRGWGKSSDPGWGYDVATQSEDVIAFMDALKIQKAVLVGRVPACMDMTWIAEHHPQRVAALVYWNRPHVAHLSKDSLLWQYDKAMATMGCDLGDAAIIKVTARNSWQPHYIKAKPGSLAIPALCFSYGEAQDTSSIEKRFFEWGLMMVKQNPAMLCDSAAREYFLAVSKNEELQNKIRAALNEADHSPAVHASFKKAFTPALKMVNIPEVTEKYQAEESMDKYWEEIASEFYLKHISEFIGKLKK